MTSPKIIEVKPLEGKRLLVIFENNVEKVYDCTPLLAMERFALLRTDAFFRSVQVDSGGYGISWNDEIDLSEDELWHNSVEQIDQDEMASQFAQTSSA